MAQLFYYQSQKGNFGDDLNLWFWDHAVPGWCDMGGDLTLFGIGTLLSEVNLERPGRSLILGSGTGYGPPPRPEDLARADIRALRGPRTAAALGCRPELAVADPAILLPRMELSFLSGLSPGSGGEVFIPHHHSMALGLDWSAICQDAGIRLQSPTESPETVIRRIAESRLIIAESMHAAIIADAFRVPWVAVRFNPGFNLFKWKDWGDSLDVPIDPLDLLAMPRQVLAMTERLRTRRAGKSAATGRAAAKSRPRSGQKQLDLFRNRLTRHRALLTPYIRHRLRLAAKRRPELSDHAKLTKAQDRLLEIFADLQQNPL